MTTSWLEDVQTVDFKHLSPKQATLSIAVTGDSSGSAMAAAVVPAPAPGFDCKSI